MSNIAEHKKISEALCVPKTMQAVTLSGVGEDNLRLATLTVPECEDNQLLCRVDAVMACASDNKLIDQGPAHPLMYGWDVSKYPTIIGHEGAVTIVEVGGNLKQKYRVGQRFSIQPAVPTEPRYYKERYRNEAHGIKKIAVGYTLPGLFAEYVLIPQEVIETGCMLPFPAGNIPYFGGAIAEPLSDVVAAQERIVHVLKDSPTASRRAKIGPRKNGVTLIVGAGPMGFMNIEVAMSFKPGKIIISELLENRRKKAKQIFERKANHLGIQIMFTDPSSLEAIIMKETDGKGVDDAIVALGIAKIQEESIRYLSTGGVSVFFGGTPFNDRMIRLDTHRVHYDGITVVGSSGSDPSDIERVLEMISGGMIDPGNYVAKCGGLDAAIPLIRAVRNKEIEGKGVIYPHVRRPLFDVSGWSMQKERDFLKENLAKI